VKIKRIMQTVCALALIWLSFGPAQAVSEDETAWQTVIKPKYYGDRPIAESRELIELTAPYRAEDPALVPIQITSKIPQTHDRYIKTVTLFIDNNPVPFSAAFHFMPDSGRADLAMRVRVNAYTFVRAVAETNDGALSMAKAFVKASGGCSAPIGSDLEAAMARLGKMKFKLEEPLAAEKPALAQLLISHPNITGLQMDQISRLIKPAHFVDEVRVSYNGKPVLTAQTDIAISADPNFRFYFVPDGPGELKAEIKDNTGKQFSTSYPTKL
jgi:sulfur-oxidizing protein SoxY